MNETKLQIAGAERVEELLDRLASEIAPRVTENTALIGILRRGAPLARMLAERLASMGVEIPAIGELKLKRYDDDLELVHEKPDLDEGPLDVDVENRDLVLVDDVLFTGESMLQACCFLRERGARSMTIAVLCQRGAPRLPVQAAHCGIQLEVGPEFIVDCDVPPYEPSLAITIHKKPDSDRA